MQWRIFWRSIQRVARNSMKKLQILAPSPTYISRYNGIRSSKREPIRSQLADAELHAKVTARYDEFESAVLTGMLECMTKDLACVARATPLRACYEGSTKGLAALKCDIKGAQPERALKFCPYCGTALPRTFDHYLPGASFPELSVHGLNLVPCCSSCNSTKGEKWLNGVGSRQFLHFFSDEIPPGRFLNVTLNVSLDGRTVGARFSIVKPGNMPPALWKIVQSHFSGLNLLDRYLELGNGEIADMLASCNVYLQAGGANARTFLRLQAADWAEIFGENHWRAVLAATLCNHPSFDTWVGNA